MTTLRATVTEQGVEGWRQVMPTPVAVQVTPSPVDVDGLPYSSPEPVILPIEHSCIVPIYFVACFLHVAAHRRRQSLMLRQSSTERLT